MSPILVRKADATLEPFEPAKLVGSLMRAGAKDSEAKEINDHILSELYEGITTEEIYRHAFELLRSFPQPVAARYSLRRALFGLGPTGFPFEDYLAKLYEHDGFKTKTRVLLQGKCATHEIDVLAWNGTETIIAEAKFHLQPGTKSDLQVALYTYARFLDLQDKVIPESSSTLTKIVAVTNTKFTTTAIDYASCVNIDLIGWNHPKELTLEHWIERTKLYPITVLSTLKEREKNELLKLNRVLCTDIVDNKALLSSVGVRGSRIQAVFEEGAKLCLPEL